MQVAMLANGDVRIGEIVIGRDDLTTLSSINVVTGQVLQDSTLESLSQQDSMERLVWRYGPNVEREGW